MKNLSLALNAILFLLVGILFYLHFSSKNPTTSNVSVKTKVDKNIPAEASIVYINSDSVLKNYEFAKKANKELIAKQNSFEGDINNRAKQLEGEIANFQKSAGTMTVQGVQTKEKELMQKQQSLMQYRETLAKQYVEEEQKLNKKLYENISDYLKKYSQERNRKFVLGYTKGSGGILYATDSLDVTQEILIGLNEEYNKSQNNTTPKK